MNTPVSFEIAKLLKETKFENESSFYYNKEGELLFDMDFPLLQRTKPDIYYDVPTISEVIMWIYEQYSIWVNVSITIQKKYYYQCLDITGKKDPTKNNYPSRICKPGNYFNSPTEAYTAAIEYCLNNLI